MADARSQPPRAPESPMTATARAEPRGCAGSTQYKGFKQVHREQQEKRRNRKTPPPWITRKLAVFIIYGLIIFATYVYIGRLCVPLIRRDPGAVGGGRGVGVGLLSVFCFLWVMCVWTYTKVVLTPPGFARDFVPKVPPPSSGTVVGPPYQPPIYDDDESVDPYEHRPPGERLSQRTPTLPSQPSSRRTSGVSDVPRVASSETEVADQADPETRGKGDPEKVETGAKDDSMAEKPPVIIAGGQPDRELEKDVGEFHAFPGVPGPSSRRHQQSLEASDSTALAPSTLRPIPKSRGPINFGDPSKPPPPATEAGLPPESTSRQPPRHPTLAVEYRYCTRDEIVKPYRTHHCRVCATCVLNFDHHCPWIGQCVGARNRKFFMNFVFWGCLFCLYIAISLIVINAQAHGNPDAPEIVVIALTMVFGLFTLGLVITHGYLLTLNLTTIEEYGIKGMREREEHVLASMWPWWNVRARIRTVKSWDEEWGKLKTEGNIWWLGSPRKNWEQTMGKNPWGWILPIGESEANGLDYPINPRFTPDGRWRRRAEWDPELR